MIYLIKSVSNIIISKDGIDYYLGGQDAIYAKDMKWDQEIYKCTKTLQKVTKSVRYLVIRLFVATLL